MLPAGLGGPIDGYLAALRREAGDHLAAVYAVGALALDDFSVKQSNIDLVVVGDPPLTTAQRDRLRRAERGLERAGRPPGLWYTSWEEVAGDPGRPGPGPGHPRTAPGLDGHPPAPLAATPPPVVATPPPAAPPGPGSPGSTMPGPAPSKAGQAPSKPGQAPSKPGQAPPKVGQALVGTIATPMTRALLRQDPVALMGPDWPVVGYEEADFRAWCADRLRGLVSSRKGLLVLRRAVTPIVLEASRLAQGAITGRVFSKSEAGESIGMIVAPRYRRILTDAVGYRRGAQTSMYWGPFERKYDALVLLRDLLDVATKP